MIVGVLLAAGTGSRFGGDKLLAPLANGEPVGVAAARHLLEGGMDEAVAVVRPGDEGLAEALAGIGIEVVPCPGAAEGMGASLARGVASRSGAAGWVVALGDMPWIRPDTVAAVGEALRSGAPMACPAHHGRAGHPVGFGARFREPLEACGGDQGARHLLRKCPEEVAGVPVSDPGILRDVDYPSDLPS